MEYKKEKFDEIKKNLIDIYYGGKIECPKISITNSVGQSLENKIVEKYLNNGEIDIAVVAWKAGRLAEDNLTLGFKNDNYVNGYGKPFGKDKQDLKDYIDRVRNQWQNIENNKEFVEIYENLVNCKPPKNFGAVYIINLIFFLSKAKFPIYDKYSHIALKSLYMNKAPYEIYVGDAPGKNDINKVVNMYNEYLWLLDNVFGERSKDIDDERNLDRALWVYGHAQKAYR